MTPDSPPKSSSSLDGVDSETNIHEVMLMFKSVKGSLVLERVKYLLDIDPECAKLKNSNGLLPIHHAIHDTHPVTEFIESIKCLLQVYPEALSIQTPEGDLPLHNKWACIHLSSYLIEKYTKWIWMKDKRGFLPLHYAVMNNEKKIVNQLIKAYPNGLKQKTELGFLPIHIAAKNDHKEIIELCMEKYPNGLRQKTKAGNLPLHYVITRRDFKEIFQKMIDIYPEAAKQKNRNGNLPLHTTVKFGEYALPEISQLLNIYPEGINVKNAVGELPFALSTCEEVLLLLRKARSNLHALDSESHMNHPIVVFLKKVPKFSKKRVAIIQNMLKYTYQGQKDIAKLIQNKHENEISEITNSFREEKKRLEHDLKKYKKSIDELSMLKCNYQIQNDETKLMQKKHENEISEITNSFREEKKRLEHDLKKSNDEITDLSISVVKKCLKLQNNEKKCLELEKELETTKEEKAKAIFQIRNSLVSVEEEKLKLQEELHNTQTQRDEVVFTMNQYMKAALRVESGCVSRVLESHNNWTTDDLKQILLGLNSCLTLLKNYFQSKAPHSDFQEVLELRIKLAEHGIEELNRDFVLRAINRIHEELGDLESKSDSLTIHTGSNAFSKRASFNVEDDLTANDKKNTRDLEDETEGRDSSSQKRARVSISP